MRVLILTQYYPPETGAPPNRLSDLALRLKNSGVEVSILTAMPNYPDMRIYDSYRGKIIMREEISGAKVYRAWIYASTRRNVFSRLLNYFSFVFSSMFFGIFCIKRQDYIICESPPLFLGISAYILKIFKRSKLVFNVSDLWPESAEKLGIVKSRMLLGISYRLESFIYKRSFFISGQTQGIVNNIKQRFPGKMVYWYKNGIDPDAYKPDETISNWRSETGFKSSDFIMLYAGILGYAQGLDVILQSAKKLLGHKEIKFVFVGGGPEKSRLMKIAKDEFLSNVTFLDVVSIEKMPEIIKEIDASIIPLKKLDLFKGAIPSKLFEVLAMGKPIILGVEGEAKDLFIEKGQCGLAFEPENAEDLKSKILELFNDRKLVSQLGENGRKYVLENFNRKRIASEFLSLLEEK